MRISKKCWRNIESEIRLTADLVSQPAEPHSLTALRFCHFHSVFPYANCSLTHPSACRSAARASHSASLIFCIQPMITSACATILCPLSLKLNACLIAASSLSIEARRFFSCCLLNTVSYIFATNSSSIGIPSKIAPTWHTRWPIYVPRSTIDGLQEAAVQLLHSV